MDFCRHREAYAKLIWNDTEPRITKLILERRNKVGRTTELHTRGLLTTDRGIDTWVNGTKQKNQNWINTNMPN